jgi:hypothetical protein
MMLFGNNTEFLNNFKFFNNGDKRELAGWTRWEYPSNVVMFAMEDDLCHIIMYDGTKYVLCRSELIDDPDQAPLSVGFSQFSPRLDLTVPSDQLTISPVENTNRSRIYIPSEIYIPDARYTYIVVAGDYKGTWKEPEVEVEVNEEDGSSSYYIEVLTDITVGDGVLGIGYDTLVILPAIFVSSDGKSDRVNVPQVSFLYLDLYYSGRYLVSVDKLGYDTKSYSIEITPANSYDANKVPLSEISTQSIPIFSSGDILEISISAPDPFPSSITGYSWDGSYNNRGIKALQ